MRNNSPKAFWLSFGITMAVLLPLIGVVGALGMWQTRSAQPAQQEEQQIPVQNPGSQHVMNLLAVVAGQEPGFVLIRLDAPRGRVSVAALPGQTVLTQGTDSVTLAQCYADAGPARAADLLKQTLGIQIDRYLALTPQSLAKAMNEVGTARVNLTSLLTEEERMAAGLSGPVQEFGPGTALEFLAAQKLPGHRLAALRGAVWEAFIRQNLDLLPNAVPQGLRRVSSTLLTDLSALDLYTLADTLEFLADREGVVEHSTLPGHWNPKEQRFELVEDSAAWAEQQFGGKMQGNLPAAVRDPWNPEKLPEAAPTPNPPSAMAGGL